MMKKKYSMNHPLLPKEFDLLEEYVYFGVLRYFDGVNERLNEKKEEKNINKKAFKEDAKFKNAMAILEENNIIDEEFIEGAHLYVESCLKHGPEFKKKLYIMSEDFKNDFYINGVKVFFDRYYEIYRACGVCAEVPEEMIFDSKRKRWYCVGCYKNRNWDELK
ncbi:MAG: hypothetical protein ACFE9R_06590 [Candidatus Hermodarchaeota archaeon]